MTEVKDHSEVSMGQSQQMNCNTNFFFFFLDDVTQEITEPV